MAHEMGRQMTRQTSVVVVDEHTVIRAGLRALLRQVHGIQVVADAADISDALALVRPVDDDRWVLLAGRPAKGESALETARLVARSGKQVRLLVLTPPQSQSSLDSLLLAGAHGYLSAHASERDLSDAVHAVARDVLYRCPMVLSARAPDPAAATTPGSGPGYDRLTERERDVFLFTARGYSAPEIGAALQISAKTVDTYKQRIHEKLGVHLRREYVQLALQLGLMHPE
jgi:two-component system, NarL family, response regulator NreC